MINPGKFNKKIEIKKVVKAEDTQGFIKESEVVVLSTHAQVKTTSGYTLLINNTDFEKATTNFTIRKPKATITRDMYLYYKGKQYSIEYLNGLENELMEIQAKEVTK